ncbi:diguanylate cyclase [Rhodoferax sp.]|uniref:sensor domain-containing diguanylate cyclase n=1 Tax=Rhodoferax sp. TaxID=50421 RepID=UPI00374CB941
MDVSTFNMAHALAQHADDTIKSVDTALVGLVERVQHDGIAAPALERLHSLLVLRTAELPQLNGLFIYGEDGRVLVNAQPSIPPNTNNSDREYFIYHRSHDDRGPHLGPPIRSRATGVWVIPVSRRINHPDGSFAGVALASIDIRYFNRFYDGFNIGDAGSIVLVWDGGILLTRRPLLPDSIGKNIRDTTLFRDNASLRPAGSFTVKSSQDGVERQNSFQHLQNYPLFVDAAVSKQEMLADWRADTYLHSAGVALLLLVLSSLGVYLVGQIRRRAEAESEVMQARDALQKLNQTLERLALQDGLTELANRRHFDIALNEEFHRALRNASSLALVMIDVDGFKQYNDIYGHTAGDACLQQISLAVSAGQSRSGDLAARYGGEEMAVLLPNTDAAGAIAVAEKIRAAIQALAIPHSGSVAGVVTVSAGVDALVPVRGYNTALGLIEAADSALYAAKASGRNRVCRNAASILVNDLTLNA